MSIKVSILIPTYNQPIYIVQAVESALAQTYENIEVIVSDDSTNDRTTIVLETFNTNKIFKYYKTEKNIGRVANYRKLLYEYATGEWVVMLDGDDYYTDANYIAEAVKLINRNDKIVLVGAGILIKYEDDIKSYSYNLGNETTVFDGKDVFTKYKKIPNHQTDLYNRKLATELNFYRHPSMGADSESLYRLCLRGSVSYIARDVAVWRVHDENATYTRNLKKQIKEVDFVDSIYNDAVKFIPAAKLQPWKNGMLYFVANHLLDIAIKQRQTKYVWFLIFKYWKQFSTKISLIHLLKYHGIYRTKK